MKYRVVFLIDYKEAWFDFDTVAEAGKFADMLNDNYSGNEEMSIRIEFLTEGQNEEG